MTYNFCTLFNKRYLLYGLGLYRSLSLLNIDFHLYIFAFDDYTTELLKKLNLPCLTVITLKEFEDEKLLSVKSGRTIAEYCWTSSSSTILYCLQNFKLNSCTYVDADMFFFSSPAVLIDEMGDKSISLSEHRYTKDKVNDAIIRGKYCVQFMTFKNTIDGMRALTWWRERCLEWCFNRIEDSKFGDQKYLDDWIERFAGVHVLKHLGAGLASWNINDYELFKEDEKLRGRQKLTGETFDVIFYHYHNAVLFNVLGQVRIKGGTNKKDVLSLAYDPYARELSNMLKLIHTFDPSFNDGFGEKGDYWKRVISSHTPSFIKDLVRALKS